MGYKVSIATSNLIDCYRYTGNVVISYNTVLNIHHRSCIVDVSNKRACVRMRGNKYIINIFHQCMEDTFNGVKYSINTL